MLRLVPTGDRRRPTLVSLQGSQTLSGAQVRQLWACRQRLPTVASGGGIKWGQAPGGELSLSASGDITMASNLWI